MSERTPASAPASAPASTPASTPAVLRDTRWQGHWIGPRDTRPEQGQIVLGTAGERAGFGRFLFRTTFDLDTVPESLPARITADSRYTVHLNGHEAGRGPIRSQPRRLTYDDLQLAPLAVPGENTLVVTVTYYGHANSFWMPAAANPTLGGDAVLVFEADLGDRMLVSDESWQVLDTGAWQLPGSMSGLDGVPVECLDARRLPADWRTGAPDADWRPAHIVPTSHVGSLARSQPPTDPYGPLLPRPIGPLGGDVVTPVRVSVAPPAEAAGHPHPVARVRAHLAGLTDWDLRDTAFPLVLEPGGAGQARHVMLDMGRVVCGLVRLELSAAPGTQIDLIYRELPYPPGVPEPGTAPNTGARYIARGTDDRFEAFEVNGFRYLHALIDADGPVRVEYVEVREHLYPRAGNAYFRSSDPELDALYAAGVRTVALNSHDAFTDCPTREQRAWVGDGVVHQMVHLTTSTDWRLARRYLELGNSPRPDGMLPMSVVGEIEASGGVSIPDWALHWLHGLHTFHRYSPDRAFVAELAPTARRILAWYVPYLNEDGVLADVPEWNLVDWSSVLVDGASSLLTALWARGLGEYAEISAALGNHGDAAWAEGLWERARAGYETFWDERRGTYVDHVVEGVPRPETSQAAGSAAIVSGLAPADRWDRIIDRVMDPTRLVTRSWIGGADGGYDERKMADQVRGIQRVDWDAEEEVVRAQPFFGYVVHDAAALAGRTADLVREMRGWSVFLKDGYDTFGECWGWGSPVHGWSATPTRDLVTRVLGVTPGEAGFARVRVAPAYGVLERAEGAVPTPAGLLTVSFDTAAVEVDSPLPYTLVLPDGRECSYEPGHVRVPLA
ncbi:family 78 glycoside hydrolase catalytic domain [Streptomyces sp. NPDC088812]|uniref:family 78 glycoside hydrolase catalytic domain n=1 Tax=Streptomyces sp. NPDC088812 TaxID=3365905 RepID=UPI00380E8C53